MEKENTQKRPQAFLHSGCLGDIIWSLPFIISQKGGDIYIRNKNPMSATDINFRSMYRLLLCQPYINKVIEYPQEFGGKEIYQTGKNAGRINMDKKVKYKKDIELDFDLDYFRLSPYLNQEHLITSYFTVNKCMPEGLPLPFVLVDKNHKFKNENLNKNVEIPTGKYNVIHVTQRYRWQYDWEDLINKLDKPNYFIGLKEEYDQFLTEFNVKENLIFYGDKIRDMYDMALIIQNCDQFFCNPSVGHAISISLNKPFNLVLNPGMQYLKTGLPIENILNSE